MTDFPPDLSSKSGEFRAGFWAGAATVAAIARADVEVAAEEGREDSKALAEHFGAVIAVLQDLFPDFGDAMRQRAHGGH